MPHEQPSDQLLSPSEVAAMFRVNPKTVTRWAQAGKLPCFRTLGGQRRYRLSDVKAAIEAMPPSTDGINSGSNFQRKRESS